MKSKSVFRFAALVVGMSTVASVAQAQTTEAVAAAAALALTPAGSFANVSSAALGESRTGAGVDYARYTGDAERSNYGAHLDWRSFRATVGVGTQPGLENAWMAGLSAGRSVLSLGMIRVGAEGDVGYGRIKDQATGATLNAMTGGVRVPLSFSTKAAGVSLMPYAAPGGFYGRLSSSGANESGFRATMNGGVRVAFANGIALDVGAQRVFIDNAETLFGAGLSISRR